MLTISDLSSIIIVNICQEYHKKSNCEDGGIVMVFLTNKNAGCCSGRTFTHYRNGVNSSKLKGYGYKYGKNERGTYKGSIGEKQPGGTFEKDRKADEFFISARDCPARAVIFCQYQLRVCLERAAGEHDVPVPSGLQGADHGGAVLCGHWQSDVL